MQENFVWLAIGASAITAVITRAVLVRTGARRRTIVALLSGLTLPLSATAAAWFFMIIQPPSEQAGAGMLFAMIALAAVFALPLCLLASLATMLLFSRRL